MSLLLLVLLKILIDMQCGHSISLKRSHGHSCRHGTLTSDDHCQCFYGYRGRECDVLDCQNGGRAEHLSQTCSCPSGYTGQFCEIETHTTHAVTQPPSTSTVSALKEICTDTTCKNGGHCFEDHVDFLCKCSAGFTGRTCEAIITTVVPQTIQVDHCREAPCEHGICTTLQDTFHCVCNSGYKGRTCAEAMTPCTSNPCLNEGHCYDDNTTYVCTCKDGFSGDKCEIDLSQKQTTKVLEPLTMGPNWMLQLMTDAPSTIKETLKPSTPPTTPGHARCNEIEVVLALAHGRVDHPKARICSSSNNKQSDAVIMKFCRSQNITSWKKGVQVMGNCKNLPRYVPIAQFHINQVTAKTGVLVACESADSFEFFTQSCDDDYKLQLMQWPEAETFYVIEY